MSRIILDASAIIAMLKDEPGAEIVADALPYAIVSTVSISEVYAVMIRSGIPEQKTSTILSDLIGQIDSFDYDQALLAASLKIQHKELGLSFGDCACLALAKIHHLPVMTADKIWGKLKIGIKINIIR